MVDYPVDTVAKNLRVAAVVENKVVVNTGECLTDVAKKVQEPADMAELLMDIAEKDQKEVPVEKKLKKSQLKRKLNTFTRIDLL